MNMIQRRMRQAEAQGLETAVNGEVMVCDPSGALYAPSERVLVVSDLHLEKGAAFARRGMFLPPYDTAATLSLLEAAIARYEPRCIVALGDSFHDRNGAALMPDEPRDRLKALMTGRDWIWITGNHDPEPPADLGGFCAEEVAIGAWVLRHEPTPGPRAGEIAGHLHPVAKVSGNGRSVRGPCFASDGARMIMPSFGVTTGGLNVLSPPFDGLFDLGRARAHVIGVSRIYPIPFAALCRS
ncbi:ligase-associated DNA damage response endonuclease PdeM [Aureimonas sp. ME7]|uniref:ligase-associated DNA damage response endonuclease PdeM n=1 Tax=Aureimonas sp. ME7 TaxID=2744252 RepID=UPI0015F4274C|nr:ligase-associated DNA damage response endonuclease PdeM [Aureimonas sp. ME7]